MKLPSIGTYLPAPGRGTLIRSGSMNISGRVFKTQRTIDFCHRLNISLEPEATTPISFDVVVRISGADDSGRISLFKPSELVFGSQRYMSDPEKGGALKAWVRMPADLFGFSASGISEAFTAFKLPELSVASSFLSLSQRAYIGALNTDQGVAGFVFEFMEQ